MNVVMDIDGVLADFEGKFCRSFRCWSSRDKINLEHRLPSKADRIKNWVANPKVYSRLNPILLGLEIAKFINSEGHDLCLVSSRPAYMSKVTVNWLKTYNVQWASLSLEAGNKYKNIENLNPVLVIDDIPEILEISRNLKSYLAIFDQPWNKFAKFPRIFSAQSFISVWSDALSYRAEDRFFSNLSYVQGAE